MTFSRTTILARLGRDPEVRYTPDGKAVADLNLAFEYRAGRESKLTNWTRLTVWGKQAEWLRDALKGDLVLAVNVEYRISDYTDKNGEDKKFHAFETTFGSEVINLTKLLVRKDDQRTAHSESSGEENQDPPDTADDEDLPW